MKKTSGKVAKPPKVLHHLPCASLPCWFRLNPNNNVKFLVQWKETKENCSPIVKSIHLQDKAQNTKTKEKLQVAIQIEYLARQKFFLKTSPAILHR